MKTRIRSFELLNKQESSGTSWANNVENFDKKYDSYLS